MKQNSKQLNEPHRLEILSKLRKNCPRSKGHFHWSKTSVMLSSESCRKTTSRFCKLDLEETKAKTYEASM